MLWPSLQIFVWCAVQLCDGQSARVITVNATIASERQETLISAPANHSKTMTPALCSQCARLDCEAFYPPWPGPTTKKNERVFFFRKIFSEIWL